MIGGFGNLRGKIEMWSVEKKVKVSEFEAPDSTMVSWCPDGQRFLTTTTAPRLRVGNGYKVWHYSGALQHEKAFSTGDELWEAAWQAQPEAPSFQVTRQLAPGIAPSQPVAAQNLKKAEPEVLSKAAIKNKKRKEAAKAAKLAETSIPIQKRSGDQASALNAAAAHAQHIKESSATYQGAKGLLADPMKEKKVKKLTEKP